MSPTKVSNYMYYLPWNPSSVDFWFAVKTMAPVDVPIATRQNTETSPKAAINIHWLDLCNA